MLKPNDDPDYAGWKLDPVLRCDHKNHIEVKTINGRFSVCVFCYDVMSKIPEQTLMSREEICDIVDYMMLKRKYENKPFSYLGTLMGINRIDDSPRWKKVGNYLVREGK